MLNRVVKSLLLLALGLGSGRAVAQVVGGQFAMEYLRLPGSPHVSALGGINVACPDFDLSLALQNPALLRPSFHHQIALAYNSYYADIKVMNLTYGYYQPKLKTSFGLGVQYLNYGSFAQRDIYGYNTGTFRAADMAISLMASRQYGERWRYGATVQYASSNLGITTASAIVADVGIVYADTASLWTFGAVAKNMGFMATKFTQTNPSEPLPFDSRSA